MLICITGLTGSGKTTALEYIKSKSLNVFEVDNYVHSIYRKDEKGYALIKENFGSEYINEKEVNRQKLGQLVFNDKNQLNKLNNLMLPLIKEKLLELKKEDKTIFVELAIFLNHSDYFKNIFDQVIIIKGKEDVQKQKISNLKWFDSSKQVINPIDNASNSNYIIVENYGSIDNLKHKIDELLKRYNC